MEEKKKKNNKKFQRERERERERERGGEGAHGISEQSPARQKTFEPSDLWHFCHPACDEIGPGPTGHKLQTSAEPQESLFPNCCKAQMDEEDSAEAAKVVNVGAPSSGCSSPTSGDELPEALSPDPWFRVFFSQSLTLLSTG